MEPVKCEMKKLRLLSRKGGDIPQARSRAKTRKYVLAIGDKIAGLPDGAAGLPRHDELWMHVAAFTQHPLSGSRLKTLYGRLETRRGAGGDMTQDDPADWEEGDDEEEPVKEEYDDEDEDEDDERRFEEEEEEEQFGAGGRRVYADEGGAGLSDDGGDDIEPEPESNDDYDPGAGDD